MSWWEVILIILTYSLFVYSVVLLLFYIGIGIYSIGETKKYVHKNSFTDYRILASSVQTPSISILAPAYNEGNTIIENVRSLLSIFYSNLEVIIINDGSKDDTIQKLIKAYELEKIDYFIRQSIPTKQVRAVYKSKNPAYKKLTVVDKENGGKSDALNVGINVSSNDYIVCIDVDCILEQDAILKMVKPFLENPGYRVIASGGVIRIANSCVIKDGRLIKVKLPKHHLPRLQTLEYIRAFLLGRMAWTRLNGLLIISGAFGAFDKEVVIKCGGYSHATVGEDMELVVRMRRYMEENKLPYKVTYIPDPLCWTEAPTTFKILQKQRNRWTRGTIETVWFHKKMFLNPKYGILGMLSFPYWFFYEMLAPLVEFFGFAVFLIMAFLGLVAWKSFFILLGLVICFGYMYSAFAVFMEVTTYNQYKRKSDVARLLLSALTEPFVFHPFVVWAGVKGYIDLLRKNKSWGEMTREGFAETEAANQTFVPAIIPEKSIKKKSVIQQLVKKLLLAAKEYAVYFFVLVGLFIVVRGYEIIADVILHGIPQSLAAIIKYGVLKDLSFLFTISIWLFIPFVFLYMLHTRTARIVFVVLSGIILLVQTLLVKYFLTTLVPLGADLWSYSIADIQQTVGAAGGIDVFTTVSVIVLIILTISLFIYIPKKIRVRTSITIALFVVCIASAVLKANELSNKLSPESNEYGNNLAINKLDFFYTASIAHFFPEQQNLNIYADEYSADFSSEVNQNIVQFKYVDEQQYPFLHSFDSSANVLTPFFDTAAVKPNIVIVLVEGLGRAFTNKGAYLGNFTPFLDSLSEKSLYWPNFLSEGGRTFAVLPSLLGSLPFAKNGFDELDTNMPNHLSLLNILQANGYHTSFYYGGESHFDNMDIFLKRNNINELNDEHTFPKGYAKMPASNNGFSWGYGDKELFRYYHDKTVNTKQPYCNVVLTVSTHSPFFINEQELYVRRFEQRMSDLSFDEAKKKEYRNYKDQYASILFMDDALQNFISNYQQRADFKNTVFLITGDHRLPEIPMSTKIDRYHVPLIIYSPLLKRFEKFESISTHFDIAPSVLAWLHQQYNIEIPLLASWMGSGLDTARIFRNVHAYPLMQTKNEVNDFVMGNYMLSGNDLYKIGNNMELTREDNEAKASELKAGFNQFKLKNKNFIDGAKLVPDSIYVRFNKK